jgi:hypothetical protein
VAIPFRSAKRSVKPGEIVGFLLSRIPDDGNFGLRRRHEVQSGENGNFSFENLKEGNYEIQVQASGYASFEFSVVLANADKKCKRALQIPLSIRSSACTGNVRLAKP